MIVKVSEIINEKFRNIACEFVYVFSQLLISRHYKQKESNENIVKILLAFSWTEI